MAGFSKFVRPEMVDRGRISDRDLDIIEAILRYRFSPTWNCSAWSAATGTSPCAVSPALGVGLYKPVRFPGIRTHSDFTYYLDTTEPLDLLLQHGRAGEVYPQMEEETKLNREADYAGAAVRGQHMKLGFLSTA